MIYPTINKKQQELEVVENETVGKSIFPTVSKPVIPAVQQPQAIQPTQPVQPITPTTPTKPTGLDSTVPPGLDADVVLLAKAIRQHESGNRAVLPGEGAEVGGASRYQYTHGTWKSVAQKYLKDANAPMTLENENRATYLRILDWKKKGYNPAQIASMWNAGEEEPNAYLGKFEKNTPTHKAGDPSVGVNQWGIKYDVPGHANRIYSTYKGLKGEYEKTNKPVEPLSDEELTRNILAKARKDAGGQLDEQQEAEIKRQIEIQKNSLKQLIGQAEGLGVDKTLATRLVENGMYDKLQELMEASGAAKKMGDVTKNGFKFAVNMLTEAEQMLGKLYGQTLAMYSKDEKARQQSKQDLHDQTLKLIQQIRKNKAEGKDTTRLEKTLSDVTGVATTEFEDLYDVQNLTEGQVIGASAQTVLDALGGSFTKAGVKAIESRVAGKAAQTFAPNFASGLVKQSGKQILGNVARTAGALAREGSQVGVGYGLSQGMMEDKSLGQTLVQGAAGGVVSGVFGAALGAATSGISSKVYNKTVTKNLAELSSETTKTVDKLNLMQKAGVRISNTYVKPSTTDINNGYKTTNLAKYDVGGPIDKALPKVQTKLKNYTDQLNEYIKLRGDEPTLQYGSVIDELELKYNQNKKVGSIADSLREIEKVKNELKLKYGDNWKETPIGFTDVIDDKRSAGIQAIFNHDVLKKVSSPSELVWNDFYKSLKTTLEKNSPAEYADINKAISELIPIEQAYIRRVRQLDKNNIFNIYDFIGATGALSYNPSALAIPLISRLTRSPQVANILMKSGNIEKALGVIPTDELAKWGIKKYGSKYTFEGMEVNKMNLKPQEVRSTLIKIKKFFNDRKNLPGFIDLGAEVSLKKNKVASNIAAKKAEKQGVAFSQKKVYNTKVDKKYEKTNITSGNENTQRQGAVNDKKTANKGLDGQDDGGLRASRNINKQEVVANIAAKKQQNLTTQAKNFKTADEFVKSLDVDNNLLDVYKKLKSKQNEKANNTLVRLEKGVERQGMEKTNKRGAIKDIPKDSRYNISEIIRQINDNPDGFTLSLDGKPVTSGYVVSPYKGKETILDVVDKESVREFLNKNLDLLLEDGNKFGGWRNEKDGKFYLDISVVKEKLDEAIETAVYNKQIGIFDVKNLETIFTSDYIKNQLKAVWQQANKPTTEQVAKNIAAKKIIDPKKPTTKILNELNGKPSVKRQFVEDLLKRPDISKPEKQILEEALKTEGDIIDSKLFAKKVQNELLPLEIKKSDTYKPGEQNWHKPDSMIEEGGFTPKYESVSLPEDIRGNVSKYTEHIYESPIKTSAGDVHWQYQSDKYFGHTRIEDMADSSLDKAMRKPGSTRRVIEVQADLYQKGRLENEFANFKNETLGGRTSIKDLKQIQETNKQLLSQAEKNGNIKMIEKLNIDIKNTEKKLQDLMKGDYQKLQQYNDPTAHYRMVREEVKLAARDGKTKLQFPTGETAMKIEGLGDTTQWSFRDDMLYNHKLTPDKLKVGQEIQQGAGNELLQRNNLDDRGSWIITDVLEDGKFKAMQKDDLINHLREQFKDIPVTDIISFIKNCL